MKAQTREHSKNKKSVTNKELMQLLANFDENLDLNDVAGLAAPTSSKMKLQYHSRKISNLT
jgi:hypothetical protein